MFTLPFKPQQRFWKVCFNKKWQTLRRTIKNEHELIAVLKKIGDPSEMDIFYSTSRYMNSESVKGKDSNPIIIGNDFVLDIDDTNLEQARKNALLCYNIMSINGYEPKQLVFSGNKGYHLIYDGNLATKNWRFVGVERISPKDRAEYITKKYNTFLKFHFPRCEDFIDMGVTLDPFRVIRLPGSTNQKSKKECRIITLKELKTRLAMPFSTEIGEKRQVKRADEADSPPLNTLACVQTSLRTKPFYFSNRVKGTKDRFIPVFKYPLGYDLWKALCRMKGLGTIYRFESGKWQYFISIMPQQARKIQKLVKKARCSNNSHICYYPTNMKYCGKYFDECKVKSKSHSKLINILTEDKPVGEVGVNELEVAVMNDGR